MPTFVVTFPIGGPLRAHYTKVEAATAKDAHALAIDAYGRDGFAFVYPAVDEDCMCDRHGLSLIPFGAVPRGGWGVHDDGDPRNNEPDNLTVVS